MMEHQSHNRHDEVDASDPDYWEVSQQQSVEHLLQEAQGIQVERYIFKYLETYVDTCCGLQKINLNLY